MRKKQIAIVIPNLIIGGLEKSLINMLNELDFKEFAVDLWLLEETGSLINNVPKEVNIFSFYEKEGLRYQIRELWACGKYVSSLVVAFKGSIRKLFEKIAYNSPQLIFGLLSTKYGEYDTVIVYQGLSRRCVDRGLYLLRSSKKIAWIHGNSMDSLVTKSEYLKFDNIVCVSNGAKEIFEKKYGYDMNVETIHNVFPIAEIIKKSKENIYIELDKMLLVTVSRLTPEKGIAMIPEIAKMLQSKGYLFKWLIVGDGPLYCAIKNDIVSKDLCEYVELVGEKTNPYPYMKSAYIYVQPSFTEGFCTSTMEAKILCVPVVTTDVSGMREQFIDGVNASIAKDISVDSICKEIEELINNKSIRDRYVKNLEADSCNQNKENIKKIYEII